LDKSLLVVDDFTSTRVLCLETQKTIWQQTARAFQRIVLCNKQHLVIEWVNQLEWWNFRENRLIHRWGTTSFAIKGYETNSFALYFFFERIVILCTMDEKMETFEIPDSHDIVNGKIFFFGNELYYYGQNGNGMHIFNFKLNQIIRTLLIPDSKKFIVSKNFIVTLHSDSLVTNIWTKFGKKCLTQQLQKISNSLFIQFDLLHLEPGIIIDMENGRQDFPDITAQRYKWRRSLKVMNDRFLIYDTIGMGFKVLDFAIASNNNSDEWKASEYHVDPVTNSTSFSIITKKLTPFQKMEGYLHSIFE